MAGEGRAPEITGLRLARTLAHAYPDRDWIAALGRGAVMPRADIEQLLAGQGALPKALLKAADEIERHLDPGSARRNG